MFSSMHKAIQTGCVIRPSPPMVKPLPSPIKGDIYKVPSSGGAATPLTFHEANDLMPVWSKDGKQIAFASDRFGDFDVLVIPAEGGEAKRITWHSAPEYPYSFTTDNKSVIFGSTRMDMASNRTFPTGSQPELYKVGAEWRTCGAGIIYPCRMGELQQQWTVYAVPG